jgi:hypothetical protein
MSEQDREFSKDAKDLNEYYSYHEQPYKYQDPISEEDILRRRESKDREKQQEDFKRDQDFYYKKDRKKTDDDMVQRDAKRDFEQEKRIRKPSIEIVKETTSGNL